MTANATAENRTLTPEEAARCALARSRAGLPAGAGGGRALLRPLWPGAPHPSRLIATATAAAAAGMLSWRK